MLTSRFVNDIIAGLKWEVFKWANSKMVQFKLELVSAMTSTSSIWMYLGPGFFYKIMSKVHLALATRTPILRVWEPHM